MADIIERLREIGTHSISAPLYLAESVVCDYMTEVHELCEAAAAEIDRLRAAQQAKVPEDLANAVIELKRAYSYGSAARTRSEAWRAVDKAMRRHGYRNELLAAQSAQEGE